MKPSLQSQFFRQIHRGLDESPDRDYVRKAQRLIGRLFPAQRAFVEDEQRRKALLCPRRSGKSYAAAAYLVHTAVTRPGSNCLYLTLTRNSARSILWSPPKTGLKFIDAEFELKAHHHNTFLRSTFQNGSVITLAGADSKHEIDKYRGQAYDLVVIDECKSFPSFILNELVDQVIGPALNDRLGTLVLMGTPGAILHGVFYDATRVDSAISRCFGDVEHQGPFVWSTHRWTVADNTAVPHLWAAALADKERNGWSDDNPIWKREYLGEWIADSAGLVFASYNRTHQRLNDWTPDPKAEAGHGLPLDHEWSFMLGVDLGFDDDAAFVVGAYSETCEDFFVVESYKQPEMSIGDIAQKIRELEDRFGGFDVLVGDRGGLGKMIFVELDEKYGIHIEPADKHEKRTYIELINADLHEGRIKMEPLCDLALEIQFAQWDERGKNIDSSCADHCIDAFIYMWRHSAHHFGRIRDEGPKEGTSEYWQQRMDDERHAAQSRRRNAHSTAGLDAPSSFETELDGGETDWWEAVQSW